MWPEGVTCTHPVGGDLGSPDSSIKYEKDSVCTKVCIAYIYSYSEVAVGWDFSGIPNPGILWDWDRFFGIGIFFVGRDIRAICHLCSYLYNINVDSTTDVKFFDYFDLFRFNRFLSIQPEVDIVTIVVIELLTPRRLGIRRKFGMMNIEFGQCSLVLKPPVLTCSCVLTLFRFLNSLSSEKSSSLVDVFPCVHTFS